MPPRPSADAEATQRLNQIALGYILSSALHVARDLGIADHLLGGPRSAADLAT